MEHLLRIGSMRSIARENKRKTSQAIRKYRLCLSSPSAHFTDARVTRKLLPISFITGIRSPLAVYVIKPNHRATTVVTTALHVSLVKYLQLRATLKTKCVDYRARFHKNLNKDRMSQSYNQSNHYDIYNVLNLKVKS